MVKVLGIAFSIVLLDQFTKYLVQQTMFVYQSIPVVNGLFHLTYVQNRGAAFGMLQKQTTFFILITLAVVVAIVFFLPKVNRENFWLCLALALELGGAVGNLVDRLRFGYVIDFFDFRVWPVFNVADICIVLGTALLFWQILKLSEQADKKG